MYSENALAGEPVRRLLLPRGAILKIDFQRPVYAIPHLIYRIRQALQNLAALVAAATLFFNPGDGLQPHPPWWARYGLRLGAEDVPT
jgi:hypothetical protein